MPHSIVLVDDHDLVRGGLQPLIEEDGTYAVTAQFSNGKELLDALPNLTPQPEVIILDLDMPVMNGRQALERIQALHVPWKILILTISGDDGTVLDMVRMGARGFLPKYCTRHELRKALSDIINTGYYHGELEVSVLFQSVKNGHAQAGNLSSGIERLTGREVEFIRLVCDKRELSYKLIADEMKVAFRTIDGYRESIFLKLDIKSKVGLVFYALRSGIISRQDLM